MNRENFYVTVGEDVLWQAGNGGAGAWLFPGETYHLCKDDLDQLRKDHPKSGVKSESVERHHDKSRRTPEAIAAGNAAALEKGGD